MVVVPLQEYRVKYHFYHRFPVPVPESVSRVRQPHDTLSSVRCHLVSTTTTLVVIIVIILLVCVDWLAGWLAGWLAYSLHACVPQCMCVCVPYIIVRLRPDLVQPLGLCLRCGRDPRGSARLPNAAAAVTCSCLLVFAPPDNERFSVATPALRLHTTKSGRLDIW